MSATGDLATTIASVAAAMRTRPPDASLKHNHVMWEIPTSMQVARSLPDRHPSSTNSIVRAFMGSNSSTPQFTPRGRSDALLTGYPGCWRPSAVTITRPISVFAGCSLGTEQLARVRGSFHRARWLTVITASSMFVEAELGQNDDRVASTLFQGLESSSRAEGS